MPIVSRCDPELRIVVDVYHGDVTVHEMHHHVSALLSDSTWLRTTRSLSDMSAARLTPFSDDERAAMLSLFQTRSLRLTGRQIAIIGGATSVSTARDVERRAIDNLGARAILFNDLTTACLWLGVDEMKINTTIGQLRESILTNGAEDPQRC